MKVIQEQVEFKPIVIKLESQFEVDIMSDLLAWCSNHAVGENIDLDFIVDLVHSLADLSTSVYDYVYIDHNNSDGDIKFK